jgi:CDP-diacylglycerol--serine O-phosphatidyltransferase
MYSAEGIQYVDIPEKIWLAPLFIAFAAAADFIDGFAARLVKAASPLGRELDSLADLVSFGVAPGMILYQFLRMSFMRQADGADVSMLLLLPVLILPCAAAVRLALFNLDHTQFYVFRGIPVPAVGLLIASFPLIYWTKDSHWVISILLNKWFLYGLVLLLSYGMVGRFPLMSMKFSSGSAGQHLPRLILLVIALICFFLLQWLAVPVIFLFYIVLSLVFKNRIV